jgi:hypothetical protein
MELRPFVAWDGEGCLNESDPDDYQPYCLFGSSAGTRIKGYDLSSLDCLGLLIDTERQRPEAIHVGYAFGYDVNQIIKDFPLPALRMLKLRNRTRYRGFDIEYIPGKWFSIGYGRPRSRGGAGRVSIKVFDTFSFFALRFDKALSKYHIGTEDQISRLATGKDDRPDFRYADIPDRIEPYWEIELDLMVQLMDKFRSILYAAGYKINSWHGAGALASYVLRNRGVANHLDRSSTAEIIEAARSAYIGGHFEPFLAGFYDGPIYSADINSAYGYTFSRLPSLQNGKWIHEDKPDREATADRRLGMYHIRYISNNTGGLKPLPHRDPNGSVTWPHATEGWFHASEAYLVRNDPRAEFLESWIWEDDGSYPFEWIQEIFEERLRMQEIGDATEIAHKKAIASLYGQIAQRTGWERNHGPPRHHQLEFAGAITAECRSLVYAAARSAGKGLISIDTDGVLATRPFAKLPNGTGNKLGQWKIDEYTGIFYLQSGVYWLRDREGNWLPPKSRGIPQRKLKFDDIYGLVRYYGENPVSIQQHTFYGFGQAIHQNRLGDWRKWLDTPRDIRFGGAGKRIHSERFCPQCANGKGLADSLHPLIPVPPKTLVSTLHHLPWIAGSSETPIRRAIAQVKQSEVFR